jgi:pimeloyl-ACP methyl ester carboxylesterase
MQVLFVHGMGRSPLSAWPMLRLLRKAGLNVRTFSYSATFENFDSISRRLANRIENLPTEGGYILLGHSLGGVLLRQALYMLPIRSARPLHVFLLGSPVTPSRLATRLRMNFIFRTLTGDCGQLLGSTQRMRQVAAIKEPTTSIAGVRGFSISQRFFAGELNDGVVAVVETRAPWICRECQIPFVHTVLPSSRRVAELVLATLGKGVP